MDLPTIQLDIIMSKMVNCQTNKVSLPSFKIQIATDAKKGLLSLLG